MKITAVKCVLVSAPYARSGDIERDVHGFGKGLRPASFIVVETDKSLTGVGEAYAGVYAPAQVRVLVESYEPMLLGQDPLDWNLLERGRGLHGQVGLRQNVISGIEIALWDLRGKALGVPVYQLLGGKVHDALPVYASGGNDQPWEMLREELIGSLETGYRAVKIRIGRLSPEQAVKKVAFCRDVLGAGISLGVDATCSIPTTKQAIQIARSIEPYDIHFFEEPINRHNFAGMAEIRREVSMPVAGGEGVTSLDEVEGYLIAGSVDIFQPGATVAGGITAFRRVAQLCERYFVPVAVHAWASGVGLMANYHAGFTLPNCQMLECSVVPNPLRDELLVEPLHIIDGMMQAPPAVPGLGVVLPDDLESKYPFVGG